MSSRPLNFRRNSAHLTLADLVDLEHQLREDEQERSTSAEQRDRRDRRDARIAARIAVDGPADRELLARWVDELRPKDHASPGERFERGRRLVTTLLVFVGLTIGALLVWGWLVVEHGRPINVIHFWTVLVGVQLLLLVLFVIALARSRGGGALHELLATIGAALARRRWPLGAAWGRLRMFHRTYGRVSFWVVAQMTQVFAVAFNVGAIVALLLAASVTDPSFGWRSTLLDERTVHIAAQTVARPWSWTWSAGAPTFEQVSATRYTSLDPRFTGPDRIDPAAMGAGVWAAWFGFLLGSLLCYGLVPRLMLWGVCRWRLQRALADVQPGHEAVRRLLERLRRPQLETRAAEPERFDDRPQPTASGEAHATPRGRHCQAIAWAGVDVNDQTLRHVLRQRFELEAASIARAGDRDVQQDRAAIDTAREGDAAEPIVLIVEAWEPPVGDYVDFIEALRDAVGEQRSLLVVLYDRSDAGDPVAPRDAYITAWRRRIAAMGDPALSVEALTIDNAKEGAA